MHSDRSIRQWMRDQRLDVVDTSPKKRKQLKDGISVSRTRVTLSAKAIKTIGSTKLHIGISKINGRPALLIRPAGVYTVRCIEAKPLPSGNYAIISSIAADLAKEGLRPGRYGLTISHDGYIAVPL